MNSNEIYAGLTNIGRWIGMSSSLMVFAWIMLHGGIPCLIGGGIGFLYFLWRINASLTS